MHFLLGNLTLESLPHEWFTVAGTATLILGGLFVGGLLTYFKRWVWLWKNWLTSTDPKKIGVMYIIVASLMLFRGAVDAAMIWLQQSIAVGAHNGYLSPDHFQQIFTAHGDIMVFFATMGFLFGLINIIVPLQIGARDLAFPFLNSLGFWLYVAGAILINMFFAFGGQFASAGWLSLPPLSEIAYSPGVGVDYWIWSLQISGLGTLIGGINFIVTILKMRAPGMKLMDMPMFTWTSLCSMLLVVSVFPILAITISLLWLDRYFGMHFFTSGFGGNPMMYVNLIWMWGHPEVYILVLPTFGVYSEIVSTFSQKKLFGYTSMVVAAFGITALACLVWLHHFFTMGAGSDVNAFFGIMTGVIAIPTGVQFINWVATMYKGKITFISPLYWFMGFLACFAFGGMAGVLMSLPGADYQLHNSLFLVAHFHTMIVSGALFGIFAGITYWFPKVTGFKLNESLGKKAFWCWLIGFILSFGPLYILGFLGATRRLDHYDAPGWQWLFITAGIGLLIIGLGALFQVAQIIVSIKDRKQNVAGNDPWNGRTLEWSTKSPVPFYNFAIIPTVTNRDQFWEDKQAKTQNLKPKTYSDITMPKNTAMAIYCSGFIFAAGFAFVWHITWLIFVGLIGAMVCVIIRGLDEHTEYTITAAEIEKMENIKP
ncbi:MAG: cbb3-type cytochrome c oxidase subunit I [Candidatus Doudnabacteria bacterium]|nr:cbb3-type cytochrome c oxidase subunit I [Candidatus Doudnabacteria bacterium]